MHKKKVVEEPIEIQKTLITLGLWEGLIALPPPHAPPRPSKAILWGVDAWDNRIVEFEPGGELEGLPTQRRLASPRERYLTHPLADGDPPVPETREADESQHPNWMPATQKCADGLLLVFDGDPPPPDDEPIFWTD
jgi:hypothetical protein